MLRDISATSQSEAVTRFYSALFAPGSGRPVMARQPRALADGSVLFIGLAFETELEAGPSTALYRLDAAEAAPRLLRSDIALHEPSPGGDRIALATRGEVALCAIDDLSPVDACTVDGVIEQIAWSPDGRSLALLVAGVRADIAGAQGGYAMRVEQEGPAWLPEIDVGDAADVWRRAWVWTPGEGKARPVTEPPVNVWELSWLGKDRLLLVASDHHGEGSWYGSTVRALDVASGRMETLYVPMDQVALPAGSADGSWFACVEAVCSDRGIVCGTLTQVGPEGARAIETQGVEVSCLHVGPDGCILFAGVRGFETVVGEVDPADGAMRTLWASQELTCGEWAPLVAPDGRGGALIVSESYRQAPQLLRLAATDAELLCDFATPDGTLAGEAHPLRWTAPDGLEIHGWLILPSPDARDCPLLIDVHGGPIWAHRNRWVGRLRSAGPLLARGWAVLLPNPRGASGRGQDFARRVIGDMGGADTQDLLSAVDHLVAEGRIDPKRVAVTGTSYGGFMSAWLVTQDSRFAAAIPISPVSNWYSQHFTSQIPAFDEACLEGSPRKAGGQYFDRSPVFFASGVRTPTLVMAGARDKNTPPTQALEFHRAVLEGGGTSCLCVYPEDGHSLRGYPAYLDSAARTMIWLDLHVGDAPR